MRLINVEACLEREELIRMGKQVDCRAKVLEFAHDEATKYAILSHRWIDPTEVDYKEMIDLAKMDAKERDEIRGRLGYKKILASCEQAKGDGYEWLWVDTCCIDKQSSAELSEAINSMFRWYENSRVCYAYLHDVPGAFFSTASDYTEHPKSDGWPEWFSRGWTLQEMIAASNVQFFNKDWHPIGDKRTLAPILQTITRVPEDILTGGLSGNRRPCVAQIISWAANRTTTRVEDRAYSLMGLLDVNMPMLYGEGKKAFHRLQLEIIRTSNDQSIFAWNCNTKDMLIGGVLANDPSFFLSCSQTELIDSSKFMEYLIKHDIPEEKVSSFDEDRFGVFPITNRGIQIWLPLRPLVDSDSVFKAWLPCRSHPSGPPITIFLASWESNYYRYSLPAFLFPTEETLQFRQVYLRYQDTQHRHTTLKVDDSAITDNSFVCFDTFPSKFTGNTLTLSSTDPLCVKVYCSSQANYRIAVGFGQTFGQDWIHVVSEEYDSISDWKHPWDSQAGEEYRKMLARAPCYAKFMDKALSRAERCQVRVMQTCLPQSTWILQTSCVLWKHSRTYGVKLGVFRDPGCGSVSDNLFNVGVGRFFVVHAHLPDWC